VFNDLAEHSQVVLGFTLWRIGDDGRLYWTRHESEGWSFDWSERWAGQRHAGPGALLRAMVANDSLVFIYSRVRPRS
jgi:hypothetical protein